MAYQVSKQEILRRLAFDNPWWDANARPPRFWELPRRDYFAHLVDAAVDAKVRRAVVLMGPRRVGKTVMLYQLAEELIDRGTDRTRILYVSVDTPTYMDLSLEQLMILVADHHGHGLDGELYVMFDEVQYRTDWEVQLKSMVDAYQSVTFVASGSAAAALRLKSRESGAGRFRDFMLPPLTFHEYLRFSELKESLISEDDWMFGYPQVSDIQKLNTEFINYLNFGGFPEAVFNEAIRTNPEQYIRHDIIDKVLMRDLPTLYGISNVGELYRLFTSLAYQTGEEVSLQALAQKSGVTKPTLNRYLEYLQAAFLIQMVPRVDADGRRFKRRTTFKVYITNPSIRAALFAPVRPNDDVLGHLAETAIFSQWFHNPSANSTLHYARWKSGEMDIVNKAATSPSPVLWAIEVKWSDRFVSRPHELRSHTNFAQRNGLAEILVTTRTQLCSGRHQDIDIQFVPAALYCYTVGFNIVRDLKIGGDE